MYVIYSYSTARALSFNGVSFCSVKLVAAQLPSSKIFTFHKPYKVFVSNAERPIMVRLVLLSLVKSLVSTASDECICWLPMKLYRLLTDETLRLRAVCNLG